MIDEYVLSRRERWQRLEMLVKRARGRGGQRLSASELEELGRLYRQATSDLAIARRDFPLDRVTRYLDGLVARAHPVVYRPRPRGAAGIGEFFCYRFPATCRELRTYILVSFLLFTVPFVLSIGLTLLDPMNGRMILPGSPFVDQVEQGQTWLDIGRSERSFVASSVATNNIQVTFLAFAGGVVFGLGTVYILILNGLSIGALAGIAASYGLGGELFDFVIGHGGVELSVIFIAGGAGLRIGHAMLHPGLLSRRESLAKAGQQAIVLVIGSVPLLLIAGTIEGFISPSGLPTAAKGAVGLGSTILLYIYILRAGRARPVAAPG